MHWQVKVRQRDTVKLVILSKDLVLYQRVDSDTMEGLEIEGSACGTL